VYVMLSVVMINFTVLSVVMINVTMLSVVAPQFLGTFLNTVAKLVFSPLIVSSIPGAFNIKHLTAVISFGGAHCPRNSYTRIGLGNLY
jgi:hypothetical protein